MSKTNQATKITKSSLLRGTAFVVVSNLILLLSGVLASFVVPNILSVNDYGLFRTFTLYAGYVNFFQIGFASGIYLLYGDKCLDELDSQKFRLFSRFFGFIEIFISLSLFSVSFFISDITTRSILAFISIYSLCSNINTYFQLLSQVTLRLGEYSRRFILQALLKIAVVGIFWLFQIFGLTSLISFEAYTLAYVLIFAVLMIMYVFTYRNLIFGKAARLRDCKKDILEIFKFGLPLLICDAIINFSTSSVPQAIQLLFPKEQFAYYSFCSSVMSLVNTALTACATAMFPILKRLSKEKLDKFYPVAGAAMCIAASFLLVAYFPAVYIIQHWITKYVPSITILTPLMPNDLISSCLSVVLQTSFTVV